MQGKRKQQIEDSENIIAYALIGILFIFLSLVVITIFNYIN